MPRTSMLRTCTSRALLSSKLPCVITHFNYPVHSSCCRSFRKPAVALTVPTVVSTLTRVTLATLKSSSQQPTAKSSGRKTRTSLRHHHSLVSTGGKWPADGLRLPGHKRRFAMMEFVSGCVLSSAVVLCDLMSCFYRYLHVYALPSCLASHNDETPF